MGKSVKGGKQARKEKAGQKPEMVNQSAKETTATKTEVVLDSPVQAANPSGTSFNLGKYVKSGIWIYPVLLLALMALMFYVRVIPSHDSVFTNWDGGYVNVAQDDAVYQMRLVYNTLAHFPDRIFFDPFTHYPYGTPVHFGPLFTLIIVASSLIVGLGHPSSQLVAAVGAYVPVVLGMLCIIPTYFMGKKLFGRNAGIVAAATLAVLPGQFLARSMLGFTDHHVAEVLFSASTIAFLIYALDAAKKSGLSLEKIKNKDKESLKAVVFGGLAGIAFGCYMLSWTGALLVGFMLFLYFVAQSIINHMKGEKLDYLVIIAALMYLIPAIMVLPYSMMDLSLELMYYSATQPVFLTLAFVGVLAIYGISKVLRKNKAEAWSLPASLVGIAVIGLLVSYIVMPQFFALTMAGFKVFAPSGGMLWVAEAKPSILDDAGNLNFDNLWYGFFWTFPIAICGLILLAFRVFKNNRPAEWLFLIWNLVMLWATFSQIRFTYYFAINAALLTGYFAYEVFKIFGSDKYAESFKRQVKGVKDLGTFFGQFSGQTMILGVIAIMLALIVIYPVTTLSVSGYGPQYSNNWLGGFTMLQAASGPGMDSNWFNSLTWMRDHTPDPQGTTVQKNFDYANGTYTDTLDANGHYAYPSSAYGVMSWWDYGHIITYVAHRIPNANPFQEGILENNNTEGSARFFLDTSESSGYKDLQDLGSRYVMIDNAMATGKHYAITVWANDIDGWGVQKNFALSPTVSLPLVWDSQKYTDSMMSRLYYDDCNGMSHFRLIYESPGQYLVTLKMVDMQSGYMRTNQYSQLARDNYTEAYSIYAQTRQPIATNQEGSQFVYDSKPPVKSVKTYEVVKGATITGSAPAGSNVTATVQLGINSRTFSYTQTAVADQNGVYAMTVPYPTDALKGENYSYDVKPLSTYTISYGNTTKAVDVPESAVMNGETVKVS